MPGDGVAGLCDFGDAGGDDASCTEPRLVLSEPPRRLRVVSLFRSRKGSQQLAAGGLAPSTHFGAYVAVLMMHCVSFALLGTCTACGKTGFHRRPDYREVDLGAPGQNCRGRCTDVRTIEIGSNALDQRAHVWFGQAGIGTRRAGLEAGDAFFDTGNELLVEELRWCGVQARHLFDNQRHPWSLRYDDRLSLTAGRVWTADLRCQPVWPTVTALL